MRSCWFVLALASLLFGLTPAFGQSPNVEAASAPATTSSDASDSPVESALTDETPAGLDGGEPADAALYEDILGPSPVADPLLVQSGPLRVKLGFEATVQPTWGVGTWWLLSQRFAPDENYKPDRLWVEGWFKPSVRTDVAFSDRLNVYSGVAYVGSANLGKDVFEEGNRGVWSVENAYLGLRYGEETDFVDISYGQQPYKIGSGMLIAVGAYNGFERGATTSFARRAWSEAGLVRINRGAWSLDGFYLNPNELPSGDTNTQLAGGKTEVALGTNQYLGFAYLNTFRSTYPYVAAPVHLIPDGREGVNTVHAYGRVNPLGEALPGLYVAADFAFQWKESIDMQALAYNAEVGRNFAELPFTPTLGYAFRRFSGDDPTTSRFEKFDPLFYEGAPPLWSAGSNGSLAFLNSNVLAHRVSLALVVSPRDFVNFYYWHVRADQIDSPLQFGQSGRVIVVGGEPRLVTGVPTSHLSDDFYVDHVRMVSPNVYVTTGFGVSIPGAGLREIDGTRTWVGGLVNLTVKY